MQLSKCDQAVFSRSLVAGYFYLWCCWRTLGEVGQATNNDTHNIVDSTTVDTAVCCVYSCTMILYCTLRCRK